LHLIVPAAALFATAPQQHCKRDRQATAKSNELPRRRLGDKAIPQCDRVHLKNGDIPECVNKSGFFSRDTAR
jgi:hypothetical protein